MLKTKFKFGQEILVSIYIKRIKGLNGLRTWESYPFEKPIKVIFLGGRKLANGKVEYEDHGFEGGRLEFNPSEYLDGALVCQENRNPIKVLLSDCKEI